MQMLDRLKHVMRPRIPVRPARFVMRLHPLPAGMRSTRMIHLVRVTLRSRVLVTLGTTGLTAPRVRCSRSFTGFVTAGFFTPFRWTPALGGTLRPAPLRTSRFFSRHGAAEGDRKKT